MRPDQSRDNLELHLVRVLVLVDLDVLELGLLTSQHLGELVEQLSGQQQEVIEIDGP